MPGKYAVNINFIHRIIAVNTKDNRRKT